MQGGFVLHRSQSSLIELLIIALGISGALVFILSLRSSSVESLKSVMLESDKVLIEYLKYKPRRYDETNNLLISHQCNNNSFFITDSYFFNKSVEVIEGLNNNNSFILFINLTTNNWVVYNKQERVCLRDARLSTNELNTPCGQATIIYGSWKGEAPLIC